MTDNESRLRNIIRHAEPNSGRTFPHWMGNGWFVLVRRKTVQLWHSHNFDSRTGRQVLSGPRNSATYADFAAAMGW